ncbi:MAG TPA: dimethylarginine dimethylaminohydrolase [Alphaproteobacteria bacterium]|nr:dimethylarginine dimethylaminohydrolase [Alphaproteobacteria bacterium]
MTRRRNGFSYRFTDAIVREPADSVVNGLRSNDGPPPDAGVFRTEHAAYIAALERAGVEVRTLPALEDFPDSVFIEDAALCLPEGAIVLQPGAPSRTGEAPAVEPALRETFPAVRVLGPHGSVDGGDILVTETSVLVGLSSRTDAAGFAALAEVLGSWGHEAETVRLPANVFHFKSDCSLLDGGTILASRRLANADCFKSFRVLQTADGEEPAANAVRINDTVLLADGYPRTAELIVNAGFTIACVPAGQAAILDGGLSCLSLRYSRGS